MWDARPGDNPLKPLYEKQSRLASVRTKHYVCTHAHTNEHIHVHTRICMHTNDLMEKQLNGWRRAYGPTHGPWSWHAVKQYETLVRASSEGHISSSTLSTGSQAVSNSTATGVAGDWESSSLRLVSEELYVLNQQKSKPTHLRRFLLCLNSVYTLGSISHTKHKKNRSLSINCLTTTTGVEWKNNPVVTFFFFFSKRLSGETF